MESYDGTYCILEWNSFCDSIRHDMSLATMGPFFFQIIMIMLGDQRTTIFILFFIRDIIER